MNSKTLFNPDLMDDLNATQIGRIGEYLVAAMLGGYGNEVHHTPGKGYDLLVMPSDDTGVVRVNVKTKKAAKGGRRYSIRKGKTTRFRAYKADDCDIFALVCLEDMSVTFEECSNYDGKGTIYLNTTAHKQAEPYTKWRECLSQ